MSDDNTSEASIDLNSFDEDTLRNETKGSCFLEGTIISRVNGVLRPYYKLKIRVRVWDFTWAYPFTLRQKIEPMTICPPVWNTIFVLSSIVRRVRPHRPHHERT